MTVRRQSMAIRNSDRSPFTTAITVMAGLPVVVGVAVAVTIADDARGRSSLAALAPVVDALAVVGRRLTARPWTLLEATGIALAAALAFAAILSAARGRRPPWCAALLGAVALAFAGEVLLLDRMAVPGGLLLAATVMATVIAARSDAAPFAVEPERPPRIEWVEVAVLLGLAVLAVLFRFYALNRVPAYFEGELSPYMVGATDLGGILPANAGHNGPWAPLGLLYYLPIYVMTRLAGSTVLAVRLASAAIAVLTIGAAWLLTRELAGRRVALVAAAILALDPLQIGWGRSDIHPHGATAWPGLLLAWATLRMLKTGGWGWGAAVAALMALSWFQYPSGQLVVFLPFLTLAGLAVARHGAVRALGWRSALLIPGFALWLLGYPLQSWLGGLEPASPVRYVTQLGPRFAGAEVTDTVRSALAYTEHLVGNVADLLTGVFAVVPHLFHQTFLPQAADIPARSLPFLVAGLALVGTAGLFARRLTPSTAVLGSLLLTTAAPAILSDIAYVKRAAVLYPVLEIVAAIALVQVVRAGGIALGPRARVVVPALVGVGFAAWTAVAADLWFSGRDYQWGIPPEVELAAAISQRLPPASLVLAGTSSNYMPGKLTYLLVDAMRRPDAQPMAWLVTPTDGDLWSRLAAQPGAAFDELAQRPWYSWWSGQDRRLPEPRRDLGWRRVVYLIEEDGRHPEQLERIRARCPDVTVEELAAGTEERYEFALAVCPHPP